VSKIWGAGSKTQELFKKYGFASCDDICRLSPETLHSIFGQSFGTFLYRAVRGESAELFDSEHGSHSMSAERTFEYDLYDDFAIETELFNICQTIMWRLLDSGLQSRTISVKIRYADFSTEAARETFATPVSTINTLYDRILALFRRKHRQGKGIRLIGAGLMNLKNTSVRQGDLFNGEGEKERHLEEMILALNRKHPNAALRRGRSLLADE
jgi:DNA polymerase-4